jgi:hypothetical protein
VLDGSRVTDFTSFVEEANRSIFPGYVDSVGRPWSGDLDAFNDILRGGMGTPDGGFVFRFHHAAEIREALGYPATIARLEEVLERCHPTNRVSIAARIERARRHEGETLFENIVEIICAHGPGGEEGEDWVILELDDG